MFVYNCLCLSVSICVALVWLTVCKSVRHRGGERVCFCMLYVCTFTVKAQMDICKYKCVCTCVCLSVCKSLCVCMCVYARAFASKLMERREAVRENERERVETTAIWNLVRNLWSAKMFYPWGGHCQLSLVSPLLPSSVHAREGAGARAWVGASDRHSDWHRVWHND